VFTTKNEVIEEIATAIEAGGAAKRDEYDLEQIADATFEYSAEVQAFVQILDGAEFWDAVGQAAR